jgi:hypothetical protein
MPCQPSLRGPCRRTISQTKVPNKYSEAKSSTQTICPTSLALIGTGVVILTSGRLLRSSCCVLFDFLSVAVTPVAPLKVRLGFFGPLGPFGPFPKRSRTLDFNPYRTTAHIARRVRDRITSSVSAVTVSTAHAQSASDSLSHPPM